MSGKDAPLSYALRILLRAGRDFDAAVTRIAELEGAERATEWATGFVNFFATLATNPRRYVIAADAKGLSGEVRNVIYRLAAGSAPYRLIYRVSENSADGPLVELLHLRHGAARPLTRKEAREIEAQNRE